MVLSKTIILALIVSLHTWLCFSLADRIFEKTKYTFFSYIFCIVNAVCVIFAFNYYNYFSSGFYLILVIILFFQLKLLFIDTGVATATVCCGLVIHLFVLRSIIIAIFALIYKTTIFTIVNEQHLFYITTISSYILHGVAIILFNRFVPSKYLKIIAENVELLGFIFAVTAIIVSMLIQNAKIFAVEVTGAIIPMQQLFFPFLLLVLFYVSLLMTFRIIQLHNYKKKAFDLEDQVNKQESLKNALFNLAKIVIEVNCSQDKMTRLVVNEIEIDIKQYPSYTNFLKGMAASYALEEDLSIATFYTSEEIISEYKKGNKELSYEYRSLTSEPQPHEKKEKEEYVWHKMRIRTEKDAESGDIIAFCIVNEIHGEKELEIKLRHKAERDSLTGAYNREAIDTYIKKHLALHNEGTLFVFDLDNFKEINDTFGHSYGDMVLKEVYEKTLHLFRADDLIARFGGDEFIVFTPQQLSQQSIVTKAENLCKQISTTYTNDDSIEIHISCSLGISQAPTDGIVYSDLFDKADAAMYASKKNGKNTYTIHSTHTNT